MKNKKISVYELLYKHNVNLSIYDERVQYNDGKMPAQLHVRLPIKDQTFKTSFELPYVIGQEIGFADQFHNKFTPKLGIKSSTISLLKNTLIDIPKNILDDLINQNGKSSNMDHLISGVKEHLKGASSSYKTLNEYDEDIIDINNKNRKRILNKINNTKIDDTLSKKIIIFLNDNNEKIDKTNIDITFNMKISDIPFTKNNFIKFKTMHKLFKHNELIFKGVFVNTDNISLQKIHDKIIGNNLLDILGSKVKFFFTNFLQINKEKEKLAKKYEYELELF